MSAYDGIHTIADGIRTHVQLQSETDTIEVTVVDRDLLNACWSSPGLFSMNRYLKTLTIPRFTPQGERRFDPVLRRFCEDGDYYSVSQWTLDSGRMETYKEVLELSRAGVKP